MENNTQSSTLMSSFERVYNASISSGLDQQAFDEAKSDFDLLNHRLQLTAFQTVFMAHLINAERGMALGQLSRELNTSRIRLLQYNDDIQNLLSRGLVGQCTCSYGDTTLTYFIKRDALAHWLENKPYDQPANENLPLDKFIDALYQIMNEYSNDMLEYNAMLGLVKDLVDKNKKQHLCTLIKDFSEMDQLTFLYAVVSYVEFEDSVLTERNLEELFRRNLRARSYINSFRSQTNDLLRKGLFKEATEEEFGVRGNFILSDNVSRYLNHELGLEHAPVSQVDPRRGLMLTENIVRKRLFYNDAEKVSIDKLTGILKPVRFKKLQSTLVENGMRKGFACLFYGGPGTGKTETVLQLAKATGRDIMKVDLAGVRNKWVGESEKNVKAIFDRYRNYCKKCAKAPILLLNEADGLINTRNRDSSHSVDKMENTMQNIFLEEMEKLDGILIATTNLAGNLDKAFERRFLYKIKFNRPDAEVQEKIWHVMIPGLRKNEIHELVQRYNFSGGQIENIARKVVIDNILEDKKLTLADLQFNCDNEKLAGPVVAKKVHKPIGYVRA